MLHCVPSSLILPMMALVWRIYSERQTSNPDLYWGKFRTSCFQTPPGGVWKHEVFKYWWFDMIWNDVCIWPVIHFSLRAVTWFYCPDVLGVTGNDVTSTCRSLTMRRDVMWPDVRPHGLTWCDIDISLRGGTRQDVTWWFTFKDSKVFHLRTSYSPIHPLSIDRFLPWMSLNVDLWGNIDHVRYKRPEWWWLQTSRIFPQSDLSLH